jgi:hypothetical protein
MAVTQGKHVRLENLSFRQVAVAVAILGLTNWAILQFAALPNMTEQERAGLYAGWMSTPYPYAISAALIAAALWFVILYQGRYATHGKKIAAFGIALGALAGMALLLIIRRSWHI